MKKKKTTTQQQQQRNSPMYPLINIYVILKSIEYCPNTSIFFITLF